MHMTDTRVLGGIDIARVSTVLYYYHDSCSADIMENESEICLIIILLMPNESYFQIRNQIKA